MKNFNRDGRGMAVGQSDKVTKLSRSEFGTSLRDKDLFSRPIYKNRERLLLPLGRYSRSKFGTLRSEVVCGWRLLSANSHLLSRYKIGTSLAFIIIFCLLFCQTVVLPAFGQEAAGLKKVASLKVGDRIPDELWDLPLQVVNHPDGKASIKLSDYGDKKLVILDFWGTWCSSCIKEFPETKSLQDQFGKDIVFVPLSGQSAQTVKDFILTNPIAQEVDLWSVVEDQLFDEAILKYTVPHFTWIADRKVISNTSGSALNRDYISDYISTGKIRWREKVNLNRRAPFYTSLGDLSTSGTSYYYEGNLDGAGKMFGSLPFRNGRTNYHFINFTKREVFEWFIRKINRMNGQPADEIEYSPAFTGGASWSTFIHSPISIQIITGSNQSLETVFRQFQAMSSSILVQDIDGRYAIHSTGKEVAL